MNFSQILLCKFAIGSNCESEAKANAFQKLRSESEAKSGQFCAKRIRFASQFFAIVRIRIANLEPCSGSSPTWRSKSRYASSSLLSLLQLIQALAAQRQSADAHSLLLPTTQARGLPSCFRLQQAAIFLLLLVQNPLHRILRIPNNLSNDLLHVQIDSQLIF